MALTTLRPAIFLDKDGTLIPNIPFNVNPDLMTLSAGVGMTLQQLQQAGFALVVVSNQSGIAKGYFPETAMEAVSARLQALLNEWGVTLDGFYYCPHDRLGSVPQYRQECTCHKPLPGLLQQAALELDLDLPTSWMVGDILNDVEAGKRAGCKSILIDNGNETEWRMTHFRQPDVIVTDFYDITSPVLTTVPRIQEPQNGMTYAEI